MWWYGSSIVVSAFPLHLSSKKMTIDKAGSTDDVDIVIAIDDDDTTANNINNEMTNDITLKQRLIPPLLPPIILQR